MRIVFMGSADVSCTVLESLLIAPGVSIAGVVAQPDRPQGRRRHLAPCLTKVLATDRGLPVLTPEKINSPEALGALTAWAPDVIVVVAYGQFLGRRLLTLPALGCLNVHFSLLPRYRGAAPVQWAIASGDAVTGVTIMQMDSGMDSGDILAQIEEPVRDSDTAATLQGRLAPIGAQLLVRALAEVAAGRVARVPQDAARVTFAPKLRKDDGRIDWRLPASRIADRVRGFNPWPGCFTTLPERLCKAGHTGGVRVLRAEVAAGAPGVGVAAGAVVTCDAGGVLVETGDGVLRLLELQPDGGRPMSALAFLCGHALRAGDVLGVAAEATAPQR
jgi:methionyl-tRNA formyltransferase